MRGSVGGVTIGNGWMRNNPELIYPEGHEDMSDEESRSHLVKDYSPNEIEQSKGE